MNLKKAQVAIEYLTTYGWVLLVIVISSGALVYFGYLEPSRFIPNKCWFGSQLVCEDYSLQWVSDTQSDLKWRVRNNFAKDILITNIQGIDSDFPLSGCNGPHIGVGKIENLTCTVDASLLKGNKYSIGVQITFRRNETGGTPTHDLTGEIFTSAN